MVGASILSTDTGRSRLSSAIRVAVMTTEGKSPAPSPNAGSGAAMRHGSKAASPRAIRPCCIKRTFPLDCALCPKEYRMLKSLKYGRHLPLFKDLSKSSHNHAWSAARIALIVAAGVTAAGARDAHTNLSVSATVRAVANIERQSAPTDL